MMRFPITEERVLTRVVWPVTTTALRLSVLWMFTALKHPNRSELRARVADQAYKGKAETAP